MSDPRQHFVAHRCPTKPSAVSIRRYVRGSSCLETSWVLSCYGADYDYDWEGLERFGTISFCPYCGKRLEDARRDAQGTDMGTY